MDGLRSNTTVQMGTDRAFGFVFVGVFVIVGLLPLVNQNLIRGWSLLTAGVILIVTLVFPGCLRPFNRLWFYFGLGLHRVVSPIILALLFFVGVTPLGLVMRPFRRDPLGLKKDSKRVSYWIAKEMETSKETLKRQF